MVGGNSVEVVKPCSRLAGFALVGVPARACMDGQMGANEPIVAPSGFLVALG